MTRIDCHVHIVADAADMPIVASRTYTPAPALLSTLQDAARPTGVRRFVVVQPSFYGTDNRVTLQALDTRTGSFTAGLLVMAAIKVAAALLAASLKLVMRQE